MKYISKKNLDTLLDMGFEICYDSDTFIRMFNGKYNIGLELYHSEPRDEYQGVYMVITDVDKMPLKEGKGRNVISNVTRWIENYCNK